MPGGGLALLRASKALSSIGLEGDELTGSQIIAKAIEAPIKVIAENTGQSGDVVLEKCSNGEGDFGYDAEAGVYGQLLEKGIMDPAKVTRAAIENSASIAAMVLTTEALISDVKEDVPAGPAGPPPGMGGMEGMM